MLELSFYDGDEPVFVDPIEGPLEAHLDRVAAERFDPQLAELNSVLREEVEAIA